MHEPLELKLQPRSKARKERPSKLTPVPPGIFDEPAAPPPSEPAPPLEKPFVALRTGSAVVPAASNTEPVAERAAPTPAAQPQPFDAPVAAMPAEVAAPPARVPAGVLQPRHNGRQSHPTPIPADYMIEHALPPRPVPVPFTKPVIRLRRPKTVQPPAPAQEETARSAASESAPPPAPPSSAPVIEAPTPVEAPVPTEPSKPKRAKKKAAAPIVPPAPASHPVEKSETQKGASSLPLRKEERRSGLDPEFLRRCAWEFGERRAAANYAPADSHVVLTVVTPAQAFVHWRVQQSWIEQTARQRGDAWRDCRMVVRLYDVTCIEFNGFNAHRVQDVGIGKTADHCFVRLPHAGTCQLAEVGFLLRAGEFVPAARSKAVQFPPGGYSPRSSHAALLVDKDLKTEEVANIWEHAEVLEEKRKAKLRKLRIAAFAFEAAACGQQGLLPTFVSELAAGQATNGHEVHVFLPKSESFAAERDANGVRYHPLDVQFAANPVETALNYARAAEQRLAEMPAFDLFHLHEWMTGLAPWLGTKPTVLSLTSTETTRLNGAPPSQLSQEISRTEREVAQAADVLLMPAWLREKAVAEFGLDGARVQAFPMEGRLPNQWEAPLDCGKVKAEFGFGPLDRMLLFVGPLEYASGIDVLLEALPVVFRRIQNARLALVGTGSQHDALQQRAQELGVGHAVKLLGDVDADAAQRLFRSCEALVLPSRQRVEFDEAVVELARRAGRPVITTHAGPARLVEHEQTGLLTYDNPGSLVWALDRIFGDPGNSERMGQCGKVKGRETCSWRDVARLYLDLCATAFPELTQNRGMGEAL